MSNKPLELKLRYVTPEGRVVGAGDYKPEMPWYHEWLMSLIGSGDDDGFIFFVTGETTDVFPTEKEQTK